MRTGRDEVITMAGRRRSRAERQPDGRVRPMQAAGRADRIEATMRARYARAGSELERASVAHDYARAAARSLDGPAGSTAGGGPGGAAPDPAGLELALAAATRALLAAGDTALAQRRRIEPPMPGRPGQQHGQHGQQHGRQQSSDRRRAG